MTDESEVIMKFENTNAPRLYTIASECEYLQTTVVINVMAIYKNVRNAADILAVVILILPCNVGQLKIHEKNTTSNDH
eukprot:scaffold1224_cov288-Chaetoceros_neogracile.AAC.13